MDATTQIEMEMRNQELGEIRALLKLPKTATHEEVVRALATIGQFDTRIDLSSIPERYRDSLAHTQLQLQR